MNAAVSLCCSGLDTTRPRLDGDNEGICSFVHHNLLLMMQGDIELVNRITGSYKLRAGTQSLGSTLSLTFQCFASISVIARLSPVKMF